METGVYPFLSPLSGVSSLRKEFLPQEKTRKEEPHSSESKQEVTEVVPCCKNVGKDGIPLNNCFVWLNMY